MVAAIQPGAKLGPIGHVISFIANWPPLGALWLLRHNPFPWPYPSVISLLGQFPPHQPPGLHLCFWAWGGLNGFFGPFRPATAPTAHRPWSAVGDPPEPKLVTNPLDPKLAKDPLDTNSAINPVGPNFRHGTISQPWPLATTRGHQIISVSVPLNLWGIISIPPHHPYSRLQAWCIYGIIYHYAPFLLSNPMVTFSGPNSTIPKSSSQNPTPISKEDYSAHQSDKLWRQSEDSSRIPKTCICRS
ncbi:hypothetical protein O181_020538 [Austropuccinia psidii MF-1]|uniref:Uncharacterized protein n=1 Tax=Austropuccinia psidii MF-1 TaxID=1389203 RepID=A0A9Q3CD42_9BASI|nr:hypothetical protein [Austropuccinia psidii MF-1]